MSSKTSSFNRFNSPFFSPNSTFSHELRTPLTLIADPVEMLLEDSGIKGKIRTALLEHTGSLAEVLHFIVKYESAEWQEVSRQLVLKNIEIPDVSHAWVSSLQWYAKLIAMNE